MAVLAPVFPQKEAIFPRDGSGCCGRADMGLCQSIWSLFLPRGRVGTSKGLQLTVVLRGGIISLRSLTLFLGHQLSPCCYGPTLESGGAGFPSMKVAASGAEPRQMERWTARGGRVHLG